jgi:hypothetical protein
MFMRTPRSFVGHNTPLVRPRASAQLDYEGELVLVIGKAGRHIRKARAGSHRRVTLCNEGTIRDWVRHAKFNVTQGKNFDSTGSLGPWLVPYTSEAQIADIRLTHAGQWRDAAGRPHRTLIFGFRYLINYISTFTTLVPGDVIVTGTADRRPARGSIRRATSEPGDIIEVEADGVGVLRNGVVDEALMNCSRAIGQDNDSEFRRRSHRLRPWCRMRRLPCSACPARRSNGCSTVSSGSAQGVGARHEQACGYHGRSAMPIERGGPACFSVVPRPRRPQCRRALLTALGCNEPVLCLTGQVPTPSSARAAAICTRCRTSSRRCARL